MFGLKEGEMIATREAYGKALVELGKKRKDVVVLDADLSKSTKTCFFAAEFPERFFDFGVAEANMMSAAAGLALSGKVAFASTFAVFATGRAFDQVRISIAYSDANVKVCASHSGVTVGEDGASHHALEDMALMRTLPNMRVVVPADAVETFKIIHEIADIYGPFYVRLTRPKVPVLPEHDFKLGEASVMRDGDDATIVATGIMVSKALEAAEQLARKGISTRVLNMHMVKPLDEKAVVKAAKETGYIVTAEDHSVIGGLGAAVSEHLGETHPTPIARVGTRDHFGISGKPEELLENFGMSTRHITKAVEELLH
ncbi:MAG: transketolase family protein [Candidatus Diapherotrites archaeon]|nr:transketolase family protein [Candidatus Diapherotrites archaeon]